MQRDMKEPYMMVYASVQKLLVVDEAIAIWPNFYKKLCTNWNKKSMLFISIRITCYRQIRLTAISKGTEIWYLWRLGRAFCDRWSAVFTLEFKQRTHRLYTCNLT